MADIRDKTNGRPPKYATPELMQEAIDDYFAECDNRTKVFYDKEGSGIEGTIPEPYTMSGLAYALDMDRRTLVDYAHNESFFPLVKAARNRVQRDVERRLMETSNQSGAIFNLKNNFGWHDKTETDITTGGDKIQSYDPTTAAEFAEFMKKKTKE